MTERRPGGSGRPARPGPGPAITKVPPPAPPATARHPLGPVQGDQGVGPMSAALVQRLGTTLGNQRVAAFMGRPGPGGSDVQRVAVNYADTGETLYEDPASPGATAASKQFDATSYGSGAIKYELERKADHALVTVKILFVNQPRGENKFQKDKAGNFVLDKSGAKVADPTFARDVGTPTELPAGDKRRGFVTEQCTSIAASWNHYDLTSKTTPKAGPSGPDGKAAPAAPSTPVNLPLKFDAVPEFSLAAKGTHATIRVFGPSVEANRDGAHPVDSGHWYMNTKKNYAGMDLKAVSAHEYGHLVGLQDEYYRSDDQTHQMLHKAGGGAANDQELDQHTVRLMVMAAIMPVIQSRMAANIGTISTAFAASYPLLRKQLAGAVRTAWADPTVREDIVKRLEPHLKTSGLKKQLPSVVAFQTGQNLSNLSRAADALASTSTKSVSGLVLGMLREWHESMSQNFTMKGADGGTVEVSTELSSNITTYGTEGAGKAAAAGLTDTVVGGPGLKIAPSSTLLGQLEAIPEQWKEPGKGIDSTYTAATIGPSVAAAADAAVATGAFPKVAGVGQLYVRVLRLVDSTAKASARKAADAFVDQAVRGKVDAQLGGLKSQIEAEVATTLGMKAGAVAAKSPPDPHVTALATKLHAILQAQQTKANYDPKVGEITPGTGSAGMDVRHSSNSVMSSNDTSKAGQRPDLVQPVVDQFNTLLKKADEENFTAKVTR